MVSLGVPSRRRHALVFRHTPPSYLAILKTCALLMGPLGSSEFLIRAVALAAARHHSSLLNPASVNYHYVPHPRALDFVRSVLEKVQAPEEVKNQRTGNFGGGSNETRKRHGAIAFAE